MKPRPPNTVYIQAGARYWLATFAEFRVLLEALAAGMRPDMDLILETIPTKPIVASLVPGEDKRRIPWENGAARDLDAATPAAARAYLANWPH